MVICQCRSPRLAATTAPNTSAHFAQAAAISVVPATQCISRGVIFSSACNTGVTRRGFRRGVIMRGVRESRAMAHKSAETTAQLRRELLEVVGAQLIHGDLHDKRWLCDGSGGIAALRSQRRRREQQQRTDKKRSATQSDVTENRSGWHAAQFSARLQAWTFRTRQRLDKYAPFVQ